MSRDQVIVPGEKPLPSERALAIQIVILTLGMLGYVAFTVYLAWIGFFPDVSVMS